MYKLKFQNINLLSNKPKFASKKYVIVFYGLGCSSLDLKFILLRNKTKNQILIPDLPGHNKNYYNKDSLYDFTKKIFVMIKKKKIGNPIIFCHSVGGIIPILLFKYFLNQKNILFVNYEGNLTENDTETLTKKTASYDKNLFIKEKFYKLLYLSSRSEKKFLRIWSESLGQTFPPTFYEISKECVRLSKRSILLSFYKTYFKKKVYLFGENTNLGIPERDYGLIRFKLRNSGHFSYYEDKFEFAKVFNHLILKRY